MAGAHTGCLIVGEIGRLYAQYSVDDPRRFASVAIDRENGWAVTRTFRELLATSGIGVRALPVTAENTDQGCRREDLLFSLRNAVDQGYLKIALDEEDARPRHADKMGRPFCGTRARGWCESVCA